MSTRTDLIHDLSQSKKLIPWMCRSILATALFRCWYLIVLITAWAACVSIINDKIRNLSIQPTLLTAFGTILGFVISYRTSSAFERYNEGRRLWSTIILASRTFSRTVWFHIPDEPKIPTAASRPPSAAADATLASHEGQPTGLRLARARVLIEKRTTINLIEAFSIAVKHYLRGEDGIYYEDLYKLVKFLPAYALPNSTKMQDDCECSGGGDGAVSESPVRGTRQQSWTSGSTALPELPDEVRITIPDVQEKFVSPRRGATLRNHTQPNAKQADGQDKEPSSYIAALQHRQAIDVPTTNTLLLGLNQLVDSLSGLERILTTPIPFSYGTQLWISCFLYLGVLPFQLWQSMGYITIPATAIASFIFFGFLAAGEEIENLVIQSCITISQRFRTMAGYDKNDLDMDYFCKILIRAELDALMSVPVPKPEEWAFSEDNNYLFESDDAEIPGRSPKNG
ncbi:Bestrophin, RFP-TM, chloride channel [Rhizoctonia solani]|uniref:Bestrophin, RFP-TM, chloride channel n=1 Tax=Rhizoctonia solani TaxID=456999 RepID=A0A8H7IJ18_9AGAM|nr:Bestrophin, RFP-TM, chloride channel [Rhizoctonia solani]